MSFDLSRVRFDARQDFLGVVMQQGRVQLDADWNEWVAQLGRRLQAGSWDTFNGSVVPRTTPDGFRIEAAGGALSIGAGRMYVDGLLAENHGGTPDAWDPHLAELAGTTALDYLDQPYYPEPPALPAAGPHLVYLDVWQRDVTALQVPGLIEPAVGVDTTGRRQTVWQVKLLPIDGAISCATPDEDIPAWVAATAPSAARLSTATGDPGFEPNPCSVPPAAGYRGLENQLYRVEVHQGGALGTATFKWSRDNASVASRATHINPARDRVTVESIGRDDVLRFNDGDWVEVTDDHRELHGLPGELRRIRAASGVDPIARTLTFDQPLSAGLFPTDAQQATDPLRNTRVRRWDQSGQVRREDGSAVAGQDLDAPASNGAILIPPLGTRLFLEHGILVEFSLDPAGGLFRSGDHWVFAARSTNATIEELDRAPSLGIHHHHARLAVVNFPDAETDCRTLWPPMPEGHGCDCSVCVSAENHNNGSATLQQAVDSLKATGGTVCLGIGSYNLSAPLNIEGARSLRIRGQGWATVLQGTEPGTVVNISESNGVALENLSLLGAARTSGTTAVLLATQVIDLLAQHINVLGLSVGDGTSVAIGLAGNVLGAKIEQCALVAERGIASVPDRERKHLLTAELRIARNLMFCSQRAVNLDGISLHFGNTRIVDNLMLVGNQAAVVATGATLPGSPMDITSNVIYTAGDGIRAGVDGLCIEGNEISGSNERSGDGIVLEEGLDPVALDRARIGGNRLRELRGNGVVINHRVEHAVISDNHFEQLGLGALVMARSASAGVLRFSGNQCHDLGQAANVENTAFAAIQLVRVERADLLDNSLGRVARTATGSPAIDAVRALAMGQLRIAGNRCFGIGPDRGSGQISGLHVPPPFEHCAIDDNQVERIGDDGQKPEPLAWRAINIAPGSGVRFTHFAMASFVSAGEMGFLLTESLAAAVPARTGILSIRGNRLRGHHSSVPLNRCTGVVDCLFNTNHCEAVGESSAQPVVGQLGARTLNASNNRLIGLGDLQTLFLFPELKRAIVMGNTSTGPIVVQGGTPTPADINLTNVIGL
ncbi:right-handed parallel beta-helix repeat-containing protein [Hydrogenophaga taeniospiralis]|uniref:DUF6519 domain-containing protein n=1 Tax=Hydrogenophaga taeniospiralis TaxID=65656 RepID=UPI001CFB9B77|nr:DUF6519 domain-containing protein [Hydrogenophaga taeniospiralis]MCB4365022.1 right-handed parallel beta-helix repeat-containing protein [Hydrogenophaga taeniospiralis]